MAAGDYEVIDSAPMCPIGYLATPIGPTDTVIEVVGFQSVEGADVDLMVGMAVMINDEIMRLNSKNLPTLSVSRGCADTLPAKFHPSNSVVWFFDNDTGTDGREYTAASTVGVKLLPYTSGGAVPVASAPPHTLTFNWRFARPYPPANIKCNGVPWDGEPQGFSQSDNALTLSWVHRNRVLQSDQLIGHGEASVTPESGTTYGITVHKQTGELVRTVTVPGGTTWSYPISQAHSDGVGAAGYIELFSQRDGLTSFQKRVIELVVGLGIPQISEFVFGGAVDAGSVVTIKLGTSTFTYTMLASDSIQQVAWKLAQMIKAAGNWVASASEGIVHVTGKTALPFTTYAIVDGPDAVTPAVVTVTQAASEALVKIVEVDFNTVIDATKRLTMLVGFQTFNFDVPIGMSKADALSAMAGLINAQNEVPMNAHAPFTRPVHLNDGSWYVLQTAFYLNPPATRLIVTSDSGNTFENESFTYYNLWGGLPGDRYWDAKYGARRFSIIYNQGDFKRQVITQDDGAEPVITDRFQSYPTTGSGAGINIFAAFADTEKMFIVGEPHVGSPPLTPNLYSTTDGKNATLIGSMNLAAGATDPNNRFRSANFVQGEAKLLKVGARWFLMGVYGLYYTDETVPQYNWRHVPLGLGESTASVQLTLLAASGSTIVAGTSNASYPSGQLKYSLDLGATWSGVTLPSGSEFAPISKVVMTSTQVRAYGRMPSTDQVKDVFAASLSDLTTWVKHTPSGLPLTYAPNIHLYEDYFIAISESGDIFASEDGINFEQSTIPANVTISNIMSVVASSTADEIVLTGTTPDLDFVVSAESSLKPLTTVSYETLREAVALGSATGMGEALGINLGGVPT